MESFCASKALPEDFQGRCLPISLETGEISFQIKSIAG
jgi:hypothetical protein